MTRPLKKIAIIGVGLIGGSFGLICRQKKLAESVWGFSRRDSTLVKARELGLISDYSTRLENVVENADLVLMATPVESIMSIGEKIVPCLSKDTIVTDVGSTKEKIVRLMEEILPPAVKFVGGHPVAGTEQSGPEAAFADLFSKRHCILTPTGKTDPEALALVKELWEHTGALVSTMEPKKHDRLLAIISHLPHMAAYALVNAISKNEKEFPGLFSYTAGGFKDFSRIASSSPVMWKEICMQNQHAIMEGIEGYRSALSEIGEAIQAGDSGKLEHLFQSSKEIRDRL